MELAQIALFVAFIQFIIGLPALFAPGDFRKAALKFRSKVTNIRLVALVNFVIAYLMLKEYSLIEKNWETVMSVLGYLFVLRGIIMFWWPDFIKDKMKKILKNENGPVWIGLVSLAIGVFVGYLGLYVY